MAIPDAKMEAIIRDYHGFELSDEEITLIRPEIDNYLAEAQKLIDLDLSDVMSSRLLRASEGGGV